MHLENRRLVYGRKDCYCGDGTAPTKDACGKCRGTGDGPRGGKGKCKECHGYGYQYNHLQRRSCGICGGSFRYFRAETQYDSIPLDLLPKILELVPLQVVFAARYNTWNESHLGHGYIYSVTDYGRTAELDDAAVLEKIRAELLKSHIQACKIVDAANTLCRELMITVTANGYNVRTVF